MNILFVHSGADLYGASRSLLRMARALRQAGHAVMVILPFDGPLREALEQATALVVVVDDLPLLTRRAFTSPFGILGFLGKAQRVRSALRPHLDRFRPDLVHTNTATVFASYSGELRRRGIPHLWHVRESFQEFSALWPFLRRYMLSHSDRVIAVSQAVADQFGPRPSLRVLHNGFARAEFDALTSEKVLAFRRLHQLEGRLCAGVAGRLKLRRKGQETFLQAAARLRDEFPEARYVLAGRPFPGNEEHETRLRALARDLGIESQVVFAGEPEEPLAAIAAMDVLVLPSGLPEPFGGVVIEAMALSRPVIGTQIGGTPEQVEDGVTGRLIPSEDPIALAEALRQLFKDEALRRRMGHAGRERFERCFEFNAFFARLMAIYREVIPGHG